MKRFLLALLLLPCGCAAQRQAHAAPPPPNPGFCTRTLGNVDCWRNPDPGVPPGTPIADGPAWRPRG